MAYLEHGYEMKPNFSITGSRHEGALKSNAADGAELARFGKKQQLKVFALSLGVFRMRVQSKVNG